MKRIIILLSTIGFVGLLQAQEERKGFETETQFHLFQPSSESFTPNLKIRYFLSSKMAVRSTFDYQSDSKTTEINEVDGTGVGSVEKKSSLLNFSLGIEKHFKEGRVSPYIGTELKIMTGRKDEYGSRTDSLVFIPNINYSKKVPVDGYGIHVFTGVDIDVYKSLYVGTELGFLYQNLNYKRGVYNVQNSTSLTDASVDVPISGKKITSFNLVNMGVIRIGWRF